MNILEQEDLIKGMPDQGLQQEAKQPSGQVPQYLVISEIQRRTNMRKSFNADQQSATQPTIKDQVLQQGIAATQPQQPPQGMPPQGAPQGPPQGMAAGGIVRMAGGGITPGMMPQGAAMDGPAPANMNPQLKTLIDAAMAKGATLEEVLAQLRSGSGYGPDYARSKYGAPVQSQVRNGMTAVDEASTQFAGMPIPGSMPAPAGMPKPVEPASPPKPMKVTPPVDVPNTAFPPVSDAIAAAPQATEFGAYPPAPPRPQMAPQPAPQPSPSYPNPHVANLGAALEDYRDSRTPSPETPIDAIGGYLDDRFVKPFSEGDFTSAEGLGKFANQATQPFRDVLGLHRKAGRWPIALGQSEPVRDVLSRFMEGAEVPKSDTVAGIAGLLEKSGPTTPASVTEEAAVAAAAEMPKTGEPAQIAEKAPQTQEKMVVDSAGGAAIQGTGSSASQGIRDLVGQRPETPDYTDLIEAEKQAGYSNALIQLGAGLASQRWGLGAGLSAAGKATRDSADNVRELNVLQRAGETKAESDGLQRDIYALAQAGNLEQAAAIYERELMKQKSLDKRQVFETAGVLVDAAMENTGLIPAEERREMVVQLYEQMIRNVSARMGVELSGAAPNSGDWGIAKRP